MRFYWYFGRIEVAHIRLPDNMNAEAALNLYRNDPAVEHAESNYFPSIEKYPSDFAVLTKGIKIAYYSYQYGIRIR